MNRSPRTEYQINHSDLRGLSRHHARRDRTEALREVCNARKFWFGDNWAMPASTGAQAALRVLNGSLRSDAFQIKAETLAKYADAINSTPGNRLAFERVFLCSLIGAPRPQLPA